MTDTALVREVNNLRTLSAIRDADQVLVINDGEIVEKGTHQQLLDKKGFYHHLYVSQFKGQAI
jgi:ATP-binding cassette subfamily B protein